MNQYYRIPEEQRDEFMNLQIESWRKQAAMLNEIKATVKAYSGKTYSKRFDKAVEEHNTEDHKNRLYVSHSYGERLYIYARCETALDLQHEHYTEHHRVNDFESAVNLATYTPEDSKLRRIDAAETIKDIDSKIEELHQDIDRSLKAFANLEKYRAKIEEAAKILQEAGELVKGAPHEFTQLYKTEYCIKESRY